MRRGTAVLFERDRPRWLRLATVLTGDPEQARTLLASAHLRTPRRTDRPARDDLGGVEEHDTGKADTARQVLFDTYLGRRLGRAPQAESPTEPGPTSVDPDPTLVDPDPTLVEPVETTPAETSDLNQLDQRKERKLERLTRRQRAVLVLVCFEELTETETARVLEESQPAVHADLAAALSDLGLPAGQTGYERAGALLRTLAERAPGPEGLGAEVRRQRAVRRRLRSRVLAVGVAVVVLVVGVTVVPEVVRHRLPVTAREPGELVGQHRIEPPRGWYEFQRSVAVDADFTLLSGGDPAEPGASQESQLCSVVTGARGIDVAAFMSADRPDVAERDEVRIHGHRGYVTRGASSGILVVWEFAPGAEAAVECSPDLDRSEVFDLAAEVLFEQTPVLVPFRWPDTTPPPEVSYLFEDGGPPSEATVSFAGTLATDVLPKSPMVMITTGTQAPRGASDGDLVEDRANDQTCRVEGDGQVCGRFSFSTEEPTAPDTADSNQRREVLRDLLTDLEIADLSDRGTWFDARDAFGS